MTLIPVHMLLGFVLVLSLWALAALAARAGVVPGLVMLTFVWGVAVTVLGMSQDRMLIGDFHWATKMLHLTGGLVAMGQAEWLAGRIMHGRWRFRDDRGRQRLLSGHLKIEGETSP